MQESFVLGVKLCIVPCPFLNTRMIASAKPDWSYSVRFRPTRSVGQAATRYINMDHSVMNAAT